MRDLLFLAHRLPYPPNKGDKIRSFNWLKHLSQSCNVHLGCFVDDTDDLQHIPTVQAMCHETYIPRLNPRVARLRSLSGLATGQPLSVPYYRNRGLKRWVARQLQGGHIDAVLIFSGAMAQFLPRPSLGRPMHQAAGPSGLRSVCDFVDIDSDKWQQYAGRCRWPMSWLYRREAKTLLNYERQVAWNTDASLFVSAAEAGLFQRLAPEVAERTTYVENGVDTDYFASGASDQGSPYPASELPLVFTGAMDYWPNADAVQWFADEVLPAVRARVPRTTFYIVGARPGAQVLELRRRPGIEVTGAVHDIRPYIEHARMSVAPLRIARGIQNKVLEAMSMGKAVVVSPQGFDGIDAQPGRDLEVADGADAFITTVLRLLDTEDNAGMGANARRLTTGRYAWQRNVDRLLDLLQGQSLDIRAGATPTSPPSPTPETPA